MSSNLSLLLKQAQQGDSDARAEIVRAAYDDLRKLAAGQMRNERPDHTLTSTALVHEVSMKLLERSNLPTGSRGEFLAYVARAMRNLLIDHARSRKNQKRGGSRKKFSLDEAIDACVNQSSELLELNSALERLAEIDERKSRVVEMRYFGGMSIDETASALDVSPATVKRDWEVARTWLLKSLQDESGDD